MPQLSHGTVFFSPQFFISGPSWQEGSQRTVWANGKRFVFPYAWVEVQYYVPVNYINFTSTNKQLHLFEAEVVICTSVTLAFKLLSSAIITASWHISVEVFEETIQSSS